MVLRRLPRAKFEPLHLRLEALLQVLETERDDIDAFRPNRKIALEIQSGHDALRSLVEGEHFYEESPAELGRRAEALRTRAEQHLERIRRTGLPERITGGYRDRLEAILRELPRLGETLAARKAAFIRKKKEELDAAVSTNPTEASLLVLILKRALESGEPDAEGRALLAELETRYKALVEPDPV